jgi:hypothetical protein
MRLSEQQMRRPDRYQHIADAEEDEELLKVMDGLDRKDAAASRMDDIKVIFLHPCTLAQAGTVTVRRSYVL